MKIKNITQYYYNFTNKHLSAKDVICADYCGQTE